MEMIIAILIWLNCMTPGAQYTQAQYNQIVMDNQQTINAVMIDPIQRDQVLQQTGIVTPTVVIGQGQ